MPDSKFLVAFRMACLFYPVGCAAFIYLAHNLSVLNALNLPAGQYLQINSNFFRYFCGFQGSLAVLLTAFVGPSLVAPDVANNAMPLYFCRPFSRTEYVLGKMSLLVTMLSLITWIPGLASVPDPVEPGRNRMGARQLLDRERDLRRPAGLVT